MEIRSYRRVFDLERRIYRIDRFRLNPSGVPVRGIVYFLMLLCAALLLGHAPLLGLVARQLPWYLGYVLAPGLAAGLLAVIRIDGRSFHLAARSLMRLHARPRRIVRLGAGGQRAASAGDCWWTPPPLLLLPDGSEASFRRLRYRGPGAVRVVGAHRWEGRAGVRVRLGLAPHVLVRADPGADSRSEVIVLERAARLDVR